MQNSIFVEAKVQALINENLSENDVINYTDGSVVCRVQSLWEFQDGDQIGRGVCVIVFYVIYSVDYTSLAI
jgi:hypothetical protein